MATPVDTNSPLPSFRKPPVIEMAIGVEFLPLPALTVVPLVELRPIWQGEYPNIEEQPVIRPARPGGLPGLNFEIASGVPPIRIWLLNKERDELLQIQNDRLILNWRAQPDNVYPRYKNLQPRFAQNWKLFSQAVSERSLGELRPITAEVTFVNRFELQSGESLFDALTIFAETAPLRHAEPNVQMTVDLFAQDGTTQYGQQTISASRARGELKWVELTLVTRVAISNEDEAPIDKALERAHGIGVISFADVTTPKMHERWERI